MSMPHPHDRKNWLFFWNELGAEHPGIIQSLSTAEQIPGG